MCGTEWALHKQHHSITTLLFLCRVHPEFLVLSVTIGLLENPNSSFQCDPRRCSPFLNLILTSLFPIVSYVFHFVMEGNGLIYKFVFWPLFQEYINLIKPRDGQVWWLTPIIFTGVSTLRGRGGQITRSEIETILANILNPVSTKIQKISQVWWCTPVVPATWEAEAGELLEPRRWRLW